MRSRVVVIGAGPVGQTAALLLARWGIPVLVVDQRAARDPVGSKAICQQGDVLDIWAAVGVGERVAAEGVTWTTARTFYHDRELFAYSFTDPGRAWFPPFVNISQARTEQLLDEAIAAQPLVEVRWGTAVEAIEQDEQGVRLTCATGAGRVAVEAEYVLACAGAHGSEVRDALGVTFDGFSFEDRFLICDIRTDLPGWANERRFYFDPVWNPGRQVLIHPCPDSTFRIDWQVPADYDLAADEASGRLEERIRAIIGDRPYEVVWQSVYRFSSRIASQLRVGRVLLAGDCAHLVSPFGARGLNSGVADVENAAWKLAFVLNGWAPPALLDSYHTERHAAAEENLAVTTATMGFLVPQSDADRQRRRDLLERAATDPAARAQVDSGRLAEPYWYVDSPLTTPDPTRPFAGRPARGVVPAAAPGMLIPDLPVSVRGTATRTRRLARAGLLVLLTAGVDAAPVDAAPVEAATRQVTGAPVQVHRMADIDPTGALAAALAARPGEAWLVRPDAHIAAVLAWGEPGDYTAASRRLLAADAHEPITAQQRSHR